MKMFASYYGCHKVQSALAEFYLSLNKGSMWCYNIIRDNNRSISHLLQLDTITPGPILLTSNLVALKMVNPELILTFKRIEWRKFIDYFWSKY